MKITCDAPGCIRGLVHHEAWADPCRFCGGRGFITLAQLCRRIDEDESVMRKLFRMRQRMRVNTTFRILEKLHALINT